MKAPVAFEADFFDEDVLADVVVPDLLGVLIQDLVVCQVEHLQVGVVAQFFKKSQDCRALHLVLAALQILQLDPTCRLQAKKQAETGASDLVGADVEVLEAGMPSDCAGQLLDRAGAPLVVVLHQTLF